MANDLIARADIQRIAEEGSKIYEQIKSRYEPQSKGAFLAIDIESREVYQGSTSVEALQHARQQHPDTVFYVVKIGFDAAETMAHALADQL